MLRSQTVRYDADDFGSLLKDGEVRPLSCHVISSLNNVHLLPAGPLQSQGRSDSPLLVVREAMDGLSGSAGLSV